MNSTLAKICQELTNISNLIGKNDHYVHSVINEDTALSIIDLERIPLDLAHKFRSLENYDFDRDQNNRLEELLKLASSLKFSIKNNTLTVNHDSFLIYYITATNFIHNAINEITLNNNDESILSRQSKIESRIHEVLNTLNNIEEAQHSVKSYIPDMEKVKKELTYFNSTISELHKRLPKIENIEQQAASNIPRISEHIKKAETLLKNFKDLELEGSNIIEKCHEAYRITTTQGLAAGFENKAKQLQISIRWWNALLVSSLIALGGLGILRAQFLADALKPGEMAASTATIHIIMSVLLLGAPLWLAWLATRQINNKSHIAEDYEYKASIAKAFEGYKKEAVLLDKEFEKRLFSTALDRLNERPTRFIDTKKNHGSPLHEALDSVIFQKCIEALPSLYKTFKSQHNKEDKTQVNSSNTPQNKEDGNKAT